MKNTLPNIQDQIIEFTKKVPLQIVVFGQTLLIVVLIVLLPLILLAIKKNNNNSKASTVNGTAAISLSPATTKFVPSSAQNVDLLVNTGQEKVDGVQAILNFSGAVPTNLVFTANTITGLSPVITNVETTVTGKKATIAFITSNPQQPFTTNSALVKLGTFSFTSPTTGDMTIAFNTQLTTAIKNGTSEDILKTPIDSTYTFAVAQNQSVPSLSFDTLTPPNPQTVGSTFQVNIVADTATQKISGVDAQVTFDPSIVEIVSVEKSAGTLFPSFPEMTFDNATGKIFVSANIGTSASPVPVSGAQVQIAKITGRTKIATTSTTLKYVFTLNDRNDSNLVQYIDQVGQEPADILAKVQGQELIAMNPASPTPTATNTPGPTSTPGPTNTPIPSPTLTPSPTLVPSSTPTPTATTAPPAPNTIQFGLQGKNRTDADKSVELSVEAKSVIKNTTATATVTTNSTGQGQVSLVPDDYLLLVKAPGYLAKKIGTTASPVHLGGGTTAVDLSTTPLLGGDFNGDGEINEIDYTLNFLTSFRNANSVVDLDSSGNVNNLDFAIMRSNWALQSDKL